MGGSGGMHGLATGAGSQRAHETTFPRPFQPLQLTHGNSTQALQALEQTACHHRLGRQTKRVPWNPCAASASSSPLLNLPPLPSSHSSLSLPALVPSSSSSTSSSSADGSSSPLCSRHAAAAAPLFSLRFLPPCAPASFGCCFFFSFLQAREAGERRRQGQTDSTVRGTCMHDLLWKPGHCPTCPAWCAHRRRQRAAGAAAQGSCAPGAIDLQQSRRCRKSQFSNRDNYGAAAGGLTKLRGRRCEANR